MVSLWQMSPNVSAWWDWVTGSVIEWCTFSMELARASIGVGRNQCPSFLLGGSLPGDSLIWLQVPPWYEVT